GEDDDSKDILEIGEVGERESLSEIIKLDDLDGRLIYNDFGLLILVPVLILDVPPPNFCLSTPPKDLEPIVASITDDDVGLTLLPFDELAWDESVDGELLEAEESNECFSSTFIFGCCCC